MPTTPSLHLPSPPPQPTHLWGDGSIGLLKEPNHLDHHGGQWNDLMPLVLAILVVHHIEVPIDAMHIGVDVGMVLGASGIPTTHGGKGMLSASTHSTYTQGQAHTSHTHTQSLKQHDLWRDALSMRSQSTPILMGGCHNPTMEALATRSWCLFASLGVNTKVLAYTRSKKCVCEWAFTTFPLHSFPSPIPTHVTPPTPPHLEPLQVFINLLGKRLPHLMKAHSFGEG